MTRRLVVALLGAITMTLSLLTAPLAAHADGESNAVGECLSSDEVWLLIVDEDHLYKNLARSCDVTDLNHVGYRGRRRRHRLRLQQLRLHAGRPTVRVPGRLQRPVLELLAGLGGRRVRLRADRPRRERPGRRHHRGLVLQQGG